MSTREKDLVYKDIVERYLSGPVTEWLGVTGIEYVQVAEYDDKHHAKIIF